MIMSASGPLLEFKRQNLQRNKGSAKGPIVLIRSGPQTHAIIFGLRSHDSSLVYCYRAPLAADETLFAQGSAQRLSSLLRSAKVGCIWRCDPCATANPF